MDDTQPPEEHPEDQPEEDGLLSDDKHIRRDCRLIARYPHTAIGRQAMIAKLQKIAFGTKVNGNGETVDRYRAREQLSAIRTLGELDKINMEHERRVLLSGSPPERNVIQIASEQAIAMDLTILPPGEIPSHRYKQNGNGNGKKP
jgi:hypothetical protein